MSLKLTAHIKLRKEAVKRFRICSHCVLGARACRLPHIDTFVREKLHDLGSYRLHVCRIVRIPVIGYLLRPAPVTPEIPEKHIVLHPLNVVLIHTGHS